MSWTPPPPQILPLTKVPCWFPFPPQPGTKKEHLLQAMKQVCGRDSLEGPIPKEVVELADANARHQREEEIRLARGSTPNTPGTIEKKFQQAWTQSEKRSSRLLDAHLARQRQRGGGGPGGRPNRIPKGPPSPKTPSPPRDEKGFESEN